MSRHTFYPDLSDLQPKISNRTENVLNFVTAVAIGIGLAVLLVVQLSK